MLILSHRGHLASGACENTIESFQEAIRRGAQGIEFDLRLSKDGELIVVHDASTRRISSTTQKISKTLSRTLGDLDLYKQGCIPTLREVTAAIHAPVIFDMDIKEISVVPPLLQKLSTSAALRERTIISSFKSQVLEQIAASGMELRCILLLHRWPIPVREKTLRRMLESTHPWAVGIPWTLATQNRIQTLRTYGVRVAIWDLRGSELEARRIAKLAPDIAIIRRTDCLS